MKFIYKNLAAEVEHNKTETIPWGWGSADSKQKLVDINSSFQAQIAHDDKTCAVGLIPDAPWNKNFKTMAYAIKACPDSTIQVYEQGVAVGPLLVRYKKDDILIISAEGTRAAPRVRYYVNTELVYESLTAPRFPLRAAIAAFEEGSGVTEARVVGNWAV